MINTVVLAGEMPGPMGPMLSPNACQRWYDRHAWGRASAPYMEMGPMQNIYLGAGKMDYLMSYTKSTSNE